MATYDLIGKASLSGTAATVSFNNIHQTYQDLVLWCSARSDTAANDTALKMQFNSNASSSYTDTNLSSVGTSSWTSTRTTNGTEFSNLAVITGANATTDMFGVTHFRINNYSSTSSIKSVISDSAASNSASTSKLNIGNGNWSSSNQPITKITLYPGAGNFISGSNFYLYGIKSASQSRTTGKTPYVEWLCVAGGGGGAVGTSGLGAGGGGGGGVINGTSIITPGTSYTVTVGAGGTGATTGGMGTDSSVFSSTAKGGGGGGAAANGLQGGCGGGSRATGGWLYDGHGREGGDGGGGTGSASGSGGGGAQGRGGNATSASNGGVGGDGRISEITGVSTYYSGGGGGATGSASYSGGNGGPGGGGAGINPNGSAGGNGTANTGGGGGGSTSSKTAGNGGSGVVIIRYPDSYDAAASTTGSPTTATTGGYRIYTFTGTGSITI